MSSDPILIIQMQRIGDCILSFPLLFDLHRLYPDAPLWVVAKEEFFLPLMPLAPPLTYFSPSHLPALAEHKFRMAINLSTQGEAQHIMGQIRAGSKLGLSLEGKVLHIHGFWQLYRHSLTQNNRHNTFHWADLHRLDLFPDGGHTRFVHAVSPKKDKKIGLVLGASEDTKRPDLSFLTILSRALLRAGYLPFFFGGPGEAELGRNLAVRIGLPKANFAGKLSLSQVAAFFADLDLVITPDTGPMHLADWVGTPVLNLSMGSVRAQETGPYSPRQWILLPHMSCAGCWQCTYRENRCRKKFQPRQVISVLPDILEGARNPSSPHYLRLARTTRNDNLYAVSVVDGTTNAEAELDALFRTLFLAMGQKREELWGDGKKDGGTEDLGKRIDILNEHHPRLASHLARHLVRLLQSMRQGARKNVLPEQGSFTSVPPSLRLLAGFCEMYVQNKNGGKEAWEDVCQWISRLLSLLER
ncbi:MAG: glycosyltransferase family 9 protein [Desulfovibrio sp.]|nr:glycosyltransferase family 9 protein [Desulfovibrio sp.]